MNTKLSNNLNQLRNYLRIKGITQEEFSKLVGFSRNTVGKWLRGEIEISEANWLLIEHKVVNATEQMPYKDNLDDIDDLVKEPPIENFQTKNNTFKSINNVLMMSVPVVPMKAYAQYVDEFYSEASDITFEYQNLTVDQYGKGHYLAFVVSGDSMNGGMINDTPNGATVLAREIGQHLWSGSLYQSKYGHIIITNTNILMKDIIKHDKDSNTITLHSRNSSPEYTDFDLPLGRCDEEVYVLQIFKVVSRHNM